MREFELYGTVAAVVSICDCMNYILADCEDLVQKYSAWSTITWIRGGVFIFDMNTEYKYREIMGDSTIAEDRDDSSFIWDNQYDEEEQRSMIYDLSTLCPGRGGPLPEIP